MSSTSSTSRRTSTRTISWARTSPPKAPKKPKKPRHLESSEEEAPPRTPPQAEGQGQGQTFLESEHPPLENRGLDPGAYGNVPGVGDTRYVCGAEGGNGGTVSQVTVLADWHE